MLILLFTACLLLASSIDAAPTTPACAILSRSIPPQCLKFHPTKPAIVAPADNATVKYGVLRTAFVARNGNAFPVSPNARLPSYSRASSRASEAEQWIVRASLKHGVVQSLDEWLWVPLATKLLKFRNSTFEGSISGLGGLRKRWIRIDFGDFGSRDKVVNGTIVNLNRSVKATVNNKSTCQNSLFSSPASTSFLKPVIGDKPNVGLYWDPAMHAPADSEAVLMVSSGVSYMTRTQTILDLMVSAESAESAHFVIHGNPMNVPAEIKGVWKKKFALEYC